MKCIYICSVPNTGGAQQWPIVGRNDNRLYLAPQTVRELSAVSSLFLPPAFLSFLSLSLFSPYSISVAVFNRLFPALALSSLLYLSFSFLPFVLLFSIYSVSCLAARVLSSLSFPP